MTLLRQAKWRMGRNPFTVAFTSLGIGIVATALAAAGFIQGRDAADKLAGVKEAGPCRAAFTMALAKRGVTGSPFKALVVAVRRPHSPQAEAMREAEHDPECQEQAVLVGGAQDQFEQELEQELLHEGVVAGGGNNNPSGQPGGPGGSPTPGSGTGGDGNDPGPSPTIGQQVGAIVDSATQQGCSVTGQLGQQLPPVCP